MFTLTIFYVCVKDCSGWYYPYPLRGGDEGGLNQPFELHFFLWKYIYIYIYIYIWKKNTNRQINRYNSIYIYTHILTDPQKTRETSSLDHMNDNGLVMWQGHRTYENLLDTSWHILKHLNTSWRHSLASFLLRPGVEHRHWAIDLPALLIGVYWGHR